MDNYFDIPEDLEGGGENGEHHRPQEDVHFPDALDRQIVKRVQITNFRDDELLNRMNEMVGVRVERQGYRRWRGD